MTVAVAALEQHAVYSYLLFLYRLALWLFVLAQGMRDMFHKSVLVAQSEFFC